MAMMNKPKRIQGTDGIRKEVIPSKDPRVKGLLPLKAFLEKNFLTEEFMELYTYAHVRRLIQTAAMKPGDEIVIGWDPRDFEGLFTEAAVRGIRKAQGKAVVVGIIPTPAIPIYMLYRQAHGGIVVTASHNPKDQNGIKIFLADQGLKLFPTDDLRLTEAVYQASREDLSKLEEVGMREDAHEEAVEVFLNFITDPFNSWIEKDLHLFNGLTLIVDPAYGSYVGVAATAFKRLGISEVIETNHQLNGNVNVNSGVADLEGISLITSNMVDKPLARFAHYEAIQKIFETGRRKRQDILSRKAQVSGAVFDGDGDRFYYLEYDPMEDAVVVLSGDEIAFHQAKYLITRYPEAYGNSLFVNTIESDLNAALFAHKLGFTPRLTGVGDKWILLQTVLTWLQTYLDLLSERFGRQAITPFQAQLDQLLKSGEVDGEAITGLAKAIQQIGQGSEASPIHREIISQLLTPGQLKFAIGSEESGHQVTLGRLYLKTGEQVPVFAGNGLKSAVNTLVAIRSLYPSNIYPIQTYLEALRHPFSPGFKKTFYVYYTHKPQLSQGTKVWKELTEVIRQGYQTQYGEEITIQSKTLPEEPDTLYIAAYREDAQIAGIFCRNSGTEDKTGVSVRGPLGDAEKLSQIGEMALQYLFRTMKDPNPPYARAERVLLNLLHRSNTGSEAEFQKELTQTCKEVKISLDRLLKEMGEKQKLIQPVHTSEVESSGRRYQLTERGRWYLSTFQCER